MSFLDHQQAHNRVQENQKVSPVRGEFSDRDQTDSVNSRNHSQGSQLAIDDKPAVYLNGNTNNSACLPHLKQSVNISQCC